MFFLDGDDWKPKNHVRCEKGASAPREVFEGGGLALIGKMERHSPYGGGWGVYKGFGYKKDVQLG